MRKIVFLRALTLLLLHAPIVAQPPYTTSTVQGPNIITNYFDPNAGPATGPGLSISPLEGRLRGPLGQGFNTPTAPVSRANVSTASFARPYAGSYNTGTYNSGVNRATFRAPYGSLDGSVAPTTTYGSTIDLPPPDAYPAGPGAPYGAPNPYGARGVGFPRAQPLEPIFNGTNAAYGIPAQPTFLFPGLVRFCIDQWVGSDYLYEMSPNIGVVVEIVNAVDFAYAIDSNMIKSNVESIFAASDILPVAESMGDQAPLPFFHLLIFIVPAGDTYVFNISARLFEHVRLMRLDYRLPGAWQAITWEKQELVVSPENQLLDQLVGSARELAEVFTERVRYFRRLRLEQDDAIRLRCGPGAVPLPPQRDGDSRNYKNCVGFKSGCGNQVNLVGGSDLPENSRSTQTTSGRCRTPAYVR